MTKARTSVAPNDMSSFSGARFFQCMTFMRRDVVRLGALDFILRIVLAGVVGMSFVVEIVGVYLDDCAADMTGFRIPRLDRRP
jgi:hypothetical protein